MPIWIFGLILIIVCCISVRGYPVRGFSITSFFYKLPGAEEPRTDQPRTVVEINSELKLAQPLPITQANYPSPKIIHPLLDGQDVVTFRDGP